MCEVLARRCVVWKRDDVLWKVVSVLGRFFFSERTFMLLQCSNPYTDTIVNSFIIKNQSISYHQSNSKCLEDKFCPLTFYKVICVTLPTFFFFLLCVWATHKCIYLNKVWILLTIFSYACFFLNFFIDGNNFLEMCGFPVYHIDVIILHF